MELLELTDEQKEAMTDLLVLAMYSDRHIASAEDERIKRLVESLGIGSGYACQQFIDASFARVHRNSSNSEERRHFVLQMAQRFHSEPLRDLALSTLESLLVSDHVVTGAETDFLSLVRGFMGRH
jgi:hypothetical protein